MPAITYENAALRTHTHTYQTRVVPWNALSQPGGNPVSGAVRVQQSQSEFSRNCGNKAIIYGMCL